MIEPADNFPFLRYSFRLSAMKDQPTKKKLRILITAPSLDENENVSGISTLVREIIANSSCEFSHFVAGRKDSEKAGIGWIFRQFFLPLRFLLRIRSDKPDLVHINTAFVPLSIIRDSALTFVSKVTRVPVLVHPNGGRFLIEDFDNRWLEKIATRWLRAADKILVLSEFEKKNLERRWAYLDISILPNAISTDRSVTLRRTSGEKSVLFFGRIHESKGLHEIIEACKILKKENIEFRFNCYGTGPEKNFFIKEMTKILGESFHYGGIVSGSEKWQVLGESDIFLLPSRYGEGLPLAMLEAMAAGCIPVVADVASVQAVIDDRINGFMVEPYNTGQVVEKLKYLLSGPADWQNLRDNARRTVKEKFSINDYVKNLEKLYENILTA